MDDPVTIGGVVTFVFIVAGALGLMGLAYLVLKFMAASGRDH